MISAVDASSLMDSTAIDTFSSCVDFAISPIHPGSRLVAAKEDKEDVVIVVFLPILQLMG